MVSILLQFFEFFLVLEDHSKDPNYDWPQPVTFMLHSLFSFLQGTGNWSTFIFTLSSTEKAKSTI